MKLDNYHSVIGNELHVGVLLPEEHPLYGKTAEEINEYEVGKYPITFVSQEIEEGQPWVVGFKINKPNSWELKAKDLARTLKTCLLPESLKKKVTTYVSSGGNLDFISSSMRKFIKTKPLVGIKIPKWHPFFGLRHPEVNEKYNYPGHKINGTGGEVDDMWILFIIFDHFTGRDRLHRIAKEELEHLREENITLK